MYAFDDSARLARLKCLAMTSVSAVDPDGGLGVVVEIDGRYYELQATRPAFEPVRPHVTLAIEEDSAAHTKLLEANSASMALQGLKAAALDLLAFRLRTDNLVRFGDEELLFLKSSVSSTPRDFELYKAKRAFAEAWHIVEELIS